MIYILGSIMPFSDAVAVSKHPGLLIRRGEPKIAGYSGILRGINRPAACQGLMVLRCHKLIQKFGIGVVI